MLFNNKISVAFVAALVAVGEASHGHLNILHHKRGYNSTTVVTSAVILVPTPLGTGVADSVAPAVTTTASDDVTLTYTLGTGISTTVVTTTIHRTATETTFVTAVPVAPEAVVNDDTTTTISSISTSTSYITVLPASSGAAGSGSGSDSGSCAGQATVTVTEKETVTVYATPGASDSTGAVISTPSGIDTQVVQPTGEASSSTAASVSSTPSSPVTGPYGNGTAPIVKPVVSSGFLTSHVLRPTGVFRRH